MFDRVKSQGLFDKEVFFNQKVNRLNDQADIPKVYSRLPYPSQSKHWIRVLQEYAYTCHFLNSKEAYQAENVSLQVVDAVVPVVQRKDV